VLTPSVRGRVDPVTTPVLESTTLGIPIGFTIALLGMIETCCGANGAKAVTGSVMIVNDVMAITIDIAVTATDELQRN
jgi:hypothetical protein